MQDEAPKARVFISCGQKRGTDEIITAHKIGEALEKIGYKAYVALEQHNLGGLRENIFREIENSEYLVFVDFKRDQLNCGELHRGSLFCHQELAVASYVNPDRKILAFHEKGVKQPDGMMNALQVNSQEFVNRDLLPDVIAHRAEQNWNPHWRNGLGLYRNPEEHGAAHVNGKEIEYFHIRVRNLHSRKSALNCYVYLAQAIDLSTNTPIPVPTIELKWAGIMRPNALILSGSWRDFDALLIDHEDPRRARFNVFADSPHFEPRIEHCTDVELTYAVVSQNFLPARITCRLHLDDDARRAILEPVDTSAPDSETREMPSPPSPSEPYGESSATAMPM